MSRDTIGMQLQQSVDMRAATAQALPQLLNAGTSGARLGNARCAPQGRHTARVASTLAMVVKFAQRRHKGTSRRRNERCRRTPSFSVRENRAQLIREGRGTRGGFFEDTSARAFHG
jgi:hypothetical protein